MHRFFLNSKIEDPSKIIITERSIIKKITKVLRLNVGDSLFLFDNTGEEYEVVINEIKSKIIYCRLISRIEIDRELPVEINLFQSLLKKDKLEWLCQKVTEIGVKRIIPVISENCVFKELNQNKIKRYQKIIAEATIQSGGKIPPIFGQVIEFEEAIKGTNPKNLNLIADELEEENKIINILEANNSQIINLFIGPEGGFSPFEIDLARQHSLITITLGRKILRAETAAIIGCGLIANYY